MVVMMVVVAMVLSVLRVLGFSSWGFVSVKSG
jgi:hypothetical protein